MVARVVSTLPIMSLSELPLRTAAPEGALAPANERADLRDDDLHDVLTAFYAAIAEDSLLAPYFMGLDMSDHMPRIVAFWSTMLFHMGRYRPGG